MNAGVKERGLIMTGESVQATYDERKTQTRRVVKPQPEGAWATPGRQSGPYGASGDRLWVRETWYCPKQIGGTYQREKLIHRQRFESEGHINPPKWKSPRFMPRWAARLLLEITEVRVEQVQEIPTPEIWKEGIRIPVSQDRGVLWRMAPSNPAGKVPASYLPAGRLHPGKPPTSMRECARAHFADVWDTLNAKRGYGWEVNPWVWVISYRMVQP